MYPQHRESNANLKTRLTIQLNNKQDNICLYSSQACTKE